MARLTARVYALDESGAPVWFGPGDPVPEWAARQIMNPKVWSDDPQDGPPPKAARGASLDERSTPPRVASPPAATSARPSRPPRSD